MHTAAGGPAHSFTEGQSSDIFYNLTVYAESILFAKHIMERLKYCCTIMACIFVMSCSNGNYLAPNFDDGMNDWKTSMSEILEDNKENLSNIGFVLKDMEYLNDVKLDSLLFYGGEYCYFPVFSKKDSVIEVLKYDELQNLGDRCMLMTDAVNEKIRQLLGDAEKYDIIRLTWQYRGETFPSLALFNRLTGELEYDNMLFNLITLTRLDTNEMIQLLNRSENQTEVESGGDAVSYQSGNIVVATASVHWSAIGHWNAIVYQPDLYGSAKHNDQRGYWVQYNYCHERVNTSSCTWVANSDYGAFADIVEITPPIPNISHYSCKYALWAGPNGGFNDSYWNILIENDSHMSSRITEGEGYLKSFDNYPRRELEYIY